MIFSYQIFCFSYDRSKRTQKTEKRNYYRQSVQPFRDVCQSVSSFKQYMCTYFFMYVQTKGACSLIAIMS